MKYIRMVEHLVPLASQTSHPLIAVEAWATLRRMAKVADMKEKADENRSQG